MVVDVLNACRGLARQARRLEVGNVIVARIEQVQHLDTKIEGVAAVTDTEIPHGR